jgi:DNA-binding protein HU-beta
MNKNDLVTAVASEAGVSKAQAEACVNAVTTSISGTLAKGDKVSLIGFGTFSVSKRAARTGRNPQTGATIQINAKNVCKFKAGKALGDSMN